MQMTESGRKEREMAEASHGYDFKGKSVFLSGPMTGMPGWNREAFREARERVCAAGALRVFDPSLEAPGPGGEPDSHEGCMLASLNELTAWAWEPGEGVALRRPRYDAIALLPGWRSSKGALDEYHVARACGIEAVEL